MECIFRASLNPSGNIYAAPNVVQPESIVTLIGDARKWFGKIRYDVVLETYTQVCMTHAARAMSMDGKLSHTHIHAH